MAVISCPNCQGKLRFPDDSPARKVKCPTCGNSFMAGPGGPIFEKAEPVPQPKPPASKPPEPVKPEVKKKVESDFDIVDDKPSRSRRDEDDTPRSKRRDDDDDNREPNRRKLDDEDDDRPRSRRRDEDDRPRSKQQDDDDRARKKRGRDDDDDDDRPRSRRRDVDDDEDDDRPRSRRRGRVDDDDDDRPRSRRRGRDDYDDRPRSRATTAQWRNVRTGLNLVTIGFWCQVGALGILLFTLFLTIIIGEHVEELYIPAGLAGFANWVLACIGFSFFIAGPKKGNLLGLTIALIAVTAIHLALVIYLAFQKEYSFLGASGMGTIRWQVIPTQFDSLLIMIISSIFVTATLLAAILELARFILFCLVLKEYGRACKERDVSGTGMMLLIMLPSALGISLVLFLIFKMIYKNAGGGSEGKYFLFFLFLIEYGSYIAVYCMSALGSAKAKDVAYER